MLPIDVLIPALVVFGMFAVGLELGSEDLRRAALRPKAVLGLTAAQAVLLPPLAAGVARALSLPEALGFGLVLAAACPVGTRANLYSLVAGGNVALSVTQAAVSNAAALVTLPVGFALGTALLGGTDATVSVPVGRLWSQIALGLLAPASVGFLVRRRFPESCRRAGPTLKRLCLGAILLAVSLIVIDQAAFLRDSWREAAVAAGAFTLAGLGLGALASLPAKDARDRVAIVIGFPVRNLSLATLLALQSFERRDVAALAAVLAVSQALIFVAWRAFVAQAERQPAVGPATS